MHRLFVAIRPPANARELLLDAMVEGLDFRWQSDEQLHLTLRFIGEVERPLAEDLAHALGRIRYSRFDLRVRGTASFDHRSGGALWAGVEPKAPLVSLAAKIERTCQSTGLPPERRAFHPHITLARWKGHRSHDLAAFLKGTRGLTSLPFPVRDFILFESRLSRHGAHYEQVATYPLVAP